MKSSILCLSLVAAGVLSAVPVLAESNDRPPRTAPLLEIVTYETGHGTATASYFFGQPIVGSVQFRTIGDRNTRVEGFEKRGGKRK